MNKPARVFLVDDDPDDTYLLQEAFLQLEDGPMLEVFPSGGHLLETLQQLPQDELPDLILLDVHLPGLSGPEVMDRLRTPGPFEGIPVIALTGSNGEETHRAMSRLGARATIHKAAHFEELVRNVAATRPFWQRTA